MTKRPSKSKRTQTRGSADLRNRLIGAAAILATAGMLLWRPWAPTAPAPVRQLATVAQPSEPAAPRQTAEPSPEASPAAPAPAFTTASITPPTAPAPPLPPAAPRMPAALEADFDAWLIEAYRSCWTPPGATPPGDPYYPRVRVMLKADGTLSGQPKLVNPPYDPAWKPHAEAAVKAVKACDPLKVPDRFAPYHAQWRQRTVFFDPTRS